MATSAIENGMEVEDQVPKHALEKPEVLRKRLLEEDPTEFIKKFQVCEISSVVQLAHH
jgi:hypothetical protein